MTDEKPQDMTVSTRETLEKFGVLKPVRAPKVETMANEIRKRGGKLTLTHDEDGAVANVRLTQATHADTGNTIGGAIAAAFAAALRAEPAQASFLDDDGEPSNVHRGGFKPMTTGAGDLPDWSTDGDEDDEDDDETGEDSPIEDAVLQPEPAPISNRPKRGRVTIAKPADPFGDEAPNLPDPSTLQPIGDARYEAAN